MIRPERIQGATFTNFANFMIWRRTLSFSDLVARRYGTDDFSEPENGPSEHFMKAKAYRS